MLVDPTLQHRERSMLVTSTWNRARQAAYHRRMDSALAAIISGLVREGFIIRDVPPPPWTP